MTSEHSAAGSAAGYLHQIQLGLIILWNAAPERPSVSVSLEALDDVSLSDEDEGGAPVLRVQVKHSVDHDAIVTDRHEQVWRTLTIWMKLLEEADGEELPRLMFCATGTCAGGSALAALRPGSERDEEAALNALRMVAAQRPGNKATLDARVRFQALSDEEATALVGAIDVLDGQTHVEDFQTELAKLVGMHAPDPESVEEFAARVYTWWMGRAAFMLAGELDRVTGRELWAFVTEAADRVARRRLTADAEILEGDPGEEEHATLRQQTFVRQLQLVSDSNELLDLAVQDFWRAREQRGRWGRDGRLTRDEMEGYDRKLQSEWRNAWTMMRAKLDAREHVDAERRAAGLELYDNLQQRSTVRLRVDFHEPVITRGSLHGLSDRRRIGWHPDYEELLGA
jgi:ABC-3C protein